METIKANIWGEQKSVQLGTWNEIKKLGFMVRDRAFGTLNDGTQALFFYKYGLGRQPIQTEYDWHVTTEKLDDIED